MEDLISSLRVAKAHLGGDTHNCTVGGKTSEATTTTPGDASDRKDRLQGVPLLELVCRAEIVKRAIEAYEKRETHHIHELLAKRLPLKRDSYLEKLREAKQRWVIDLDDLQVDVGCGPLAPQECIRMRPADAGAKGNGRRMEEIEQLLKELSEESASIAQELSQYLKLAQSCAPGTYQHRFYSIVIDRLKTYYSDLKEEEDHLCNIARDFTVS
eukprot:Sspe_Gene.43431::Locus_21165_Transcript_2_7_Confidence_0.684_Length_836::g.43431::m.43431